MQICFQLFYLLLKYHDPYLSQFLKIHGITTELYAYSWFLTFFARFYLFFYFLLMKNKIASKLSLDVLVLFFDLYIIEEDPAFIFFFSLSLLMINRNSIISSDLSILPQSISNLTITNVEELSVIYFK